MFYNNSFKIQFTVVAVVSELLYNTSSTSSTIKTLYHGSVLHGLRNLNKVDIIAFITCHCMIKLYIKNLKQNELKKI